MRGALLAGFRKTHMNDVYPGFGVDKPTTPALPLIRQPLRLNLLERFSGLHPLTDDTDRFDQHGVKTLEVVDRCQRAMTGNDPGARWNLGDRGRDVSLIAFYVPAAGEIDVREHAVEEVIAHVNNVRAGEEDDAVTVGVPVREMDCANLFAVEVHRERL